MSEQIETAEALAALPVGSVLRNGQGVAFQMAVEGGERVLLGTNLSIIRDLVPFLHAWPLTVLYRPDTPAPAPADEDREALVVRSGDEADPHLYLLDPVEGCWGAYRLVDCVSAEEIVQPWHPLPLVARSPRPAPSVSAERESIDRACAWSDYRKEYGATAEQHAAFTAGWDAAMGRLDIGGVQR